MKMFAGSIVLVLLTIGLVACGGGEKERRAEAPDQSLMSDSEALVGTWGAGDERLTLTQDGSYTWESPRACGTPPCPKKVSDGNWQLRHGKLYLDPRDGDDRVLTYAINWNPRTLQLNEKSAGKSWTYGYAQ